MHQLIVMYKRYLEFLRPKKFSENLKLNEKDVKNAAERTDNKWGEFHEFFLAN